VASPIPDDAPVTNTLGFIPQGSSATWNHWQAQSPLPLPFQSDSFRTDMKLLLSNDDGIDAPGLASLQEAAQAFGETTVVAPAAPQSGKSHVVTWDGGVRLEARAPDRFAVHGTPADCARLGLLRVAADAQWVLSGINHGGNLGVDVYYSGTVAAIREAVLHGWPGIAFSQYMRGHVAPDWPRAARWTARVLRELLARPVEAGLFYNVNFPALAEAAPEPEIAFCPLDPNPLPLDYRHEDDRHFYNGVYGDRPRGSGTDLDVCFRGRISVTEIRLF
jgi:5'-nucleotidase